MSIVTLYQAYLFKLIYIYFQNIKFWSQFNNSNAACNQEFDAQIDTFERLLNAFKEIIFRGVKNQVSIIVHFKMINIEAHSIFKL